MNTVWKNLPGTSGEEQIFAIGDVHGELEAMKAALEVVRKCPRHGAPTRLIFNGDLNDRGPDSLKCIDLAYSAAEAAEVDEVTYLVGNHEQMMIEALQYPGYAPVWMKNGGTEVIEEFARENSGKRFKNYGEIAPALVRRLPDGFMDKFPRDSHHRAGDLLFVHAGIDPALGIDRTLCSMSSTPAWAWVRYEFLDIDSGWDYEGKTVIVHGHTPIENDPGSSLCHARSDTWALFRDGKIHTPDFDIEDPAGCDIVESHRRINLDTGCGKYLKTLVVAEFYNDQYRIHLGK